MEKILGLNYLLHNIKAEEAPFLYSLKVDEFKNGEKTSELGSKQSSRQTVGTHGDISQLGWRTRECERRRLRCESKCEDFLHRKKIQYVGLMYGRYSGHWHKALEWK